MLRNGNRFSPVARWNVDIPDDALQSVTSAFTDFLKTRQWVVNIDEYRRDATPYGNLALPSSLESFPRAWLVIPLMQEYQLLGFIVLVKPDHERRLTWEDTDLLKTVGRQVASYLAQYEAAQLLAETRQFDAYNRLTAFIMHDLKNLIAQQSLVVKNAVKHKGNPAFIEDVISTIDNSVRRMSRLLEQLRRRETTGTAERIVLSELVANVVTKCEERRPAPKLQTSDGELQVYAESDRLDMILEHIIRNAQEATPTDGYVHVRLSRNGQNAVVEIQDNGCGMDATFIRDRLFRPFDTTKGSKGMGIGAYQAREFIRMVGGEVDVVSEPQKGTTFRITLPAAGAGGVAGERTYPKAGVGE
ncbi:MAG: XrtA/PEP-CTERM system histidine kinase PrsK [Acidiferrobacterales bacterium]